MPPTRLESTPVRLPEVQRRGNKTAGNSGAWKCELMASGAKLKSWLVHVFTATGALFGMLALERAFAKDFSGMFVWLAAAFAVDGVDGTLARRADVRGHLPDIDGDVLDAVVDYLNYVIVPLAALWASAMMPPALSLIAVAAVAIASSIYFADRRMKTKDNWFRGFPALWNVAVSTCLSFPCRDLRSSPWSWRSARRCSFQWYSSIPFGLSNCG